MPPRLVVVLKRLPRGADPSQRGPSRREARILLGLDHPHVVRVLDVVDDGEGIASVTQYAPGGSLEGLLAQGRQLGPGEVVAVLAPIADACAAAHRRGIVHGDVKPANILFTSDGEPLLADFGIARLSKGPDVPLAPAGPAGTPGYLAPEVGGGGDAPTAACDVWGLGVVGHELLTGMLPAEDPAGPSLAGRAGVPDELARILDQARPSAYRLVLGVRRSEAEGALGHAWLTIDGAPVHDSPETLADLVPIVVFDGEGRREETSGPAPTQGGQG